MAVLCADLDRECATGHTWLGTDEPKGLPGLLVAATAHPPALRAHETTHFIVWATGWRPLAFSPGSAPAVHGLQVYLPALVCSLSQAPVTRS